jgi:methionyl-tRNA synthetase
MTQREDVFYLTTPIFYVNDAPHIGHAYATVAADVVTRWHRQRGERVWFLTGTDEHGTKVQRTADANGVDPQTWCDRLVDGAWLPVLDTINAANDDFIRTTEDRHIVGVQRFWERLREAGHVYASTYEGPYCVGCEEFKLPGDLLEGTGEYQGQLVCAIHGTPVEQLSEDNWFFALSKFQDALLEHYEEHPEAVAPSSARNEVVSFIKQGLQDISMSRSSVSWGIPLPWDDKQVVYVWFDALLNYATAVGYGTDEDRFNEIWPASVHLVGRDILRFHAVFWPAMLMAAGLPLPEQVFAHGWLLVGGEKMSKSKLTGIAPSTLTDHFGVDGFRWYFMRSFALGQDGSFSWEDMNARYSSELANGLGNLASRVSAMIGRYCDGELPESKAHGPAEDVVADAAARAVADADQAIEEMRIHDALSAIYSLISTINGYLTEQEPWKIAKDGGHGTAAHARVETILYTAADALRTVAILINPVMPATAIALWSSLGAAEALGDLDEATIESAGEWGALPARVTVTKGDSLFPRLEEVAEA